MITLAATARLEARRPLMEVNVALLMGEAVEVVEGSDLRDRT